VKFFNEWDALKMDFSISKVALGGMTIVAIISSMAAYNAYKTKTVLVLPPGMTKQFEASGNRLSRSYFEQVGFFLSDRLLSVSPETVDISFDTVVPFLTTDPDALKAIRAQMAAQAEEIKANDIYQVFYPMKMTVNEKGRIFTVEGMLKRMSGSSTVSGSKARINFGFDVRGGRLIITSIEAAI